MHFTNLIELNVTFATLLFAANFPKFETFNWKITYYKFTDLTLPH